jgi:hypothetical protein
MKNKIASVALSILAVSVPAISHGYAVNPTSDGSLYVCDGCNVVSDGEYVQASGYIQGAIKFSSASINGPVAQAFLTLNPYGLPLWGKDVDVYGYGTTIGKLDVSDADAGTFLGTLVLPDDLGYGQDAFFDVTSFVNSTSAPYIAFNLRATDTDVFSSIEYNYDHPSQLLLTTAVSEPSASVLILTGLVGFAFVSKRSNRGQTALSPLRA